jgi:hypothetical protein
MSRRPQSSHHLSWVVLLLAILAAFSFHTGTCGLPAHQAEPARTVVVVDADDDPLDDPAVDDDAHGGSAVAALGRATRRPESARPRPDLVPASHPARGTGPDVAVRQVAAPSGADLLTRIGVSLT